MTKNKRPAKPKAQTVQPDIKPRTSKKTKIQNKEVYELTMKEIEFLMSKGEGNLSIQEQARLRSLAEAAEEYEDTYEPLPAPSNLSDMVRIKMLQLKLKQHYTAKLLGVSEAKFSLIMNGKQKPDIFFVKALHEKLNLDANDILKAI
jgi:HTH-type transcriptional regulator / antitoxin HigA